MTTNQNEQNYVNQILYSAAGAASNAIGPFSSWLLAGFGGAFAFILGNMNSAGQYISIVSLRISIILFIFALIAGLFEKMAGALIIAGVKSFDAGSQIGKLFTNIEINQAVVISEVEKTIFKPIKLLFRRTIEKANAGDRLVMARFYSRLAQIQMIMVLIEFILCTIAAVVIVAGLKI